MGVLAEQDPGEATVGLDFLKDLGPEPAYVGDRQVDLGFGLCLAASGRIAEVAPLGQPGQPVSGVPVAGGRTLGQLCSGSLVSSLSPTGQ